MASKKIIDGYYFVVYVNTMSMLKNEEPIDFGYAYTVDVSSNGSNTCIYLDYMASRKIGENGETIFTRLYKRRRNYRMVRKEDICEYFPEHFI